MGNICIKNQRQAPWSQIVFVTAFKFIQAPTISQHFPEMFLWDRISVLQVASNVCFKKTLLWFVQIFLKQMLLVVGFAGEFAHCSLLTDIGRTKFYACEMITPA